MRDAIEREARAEAEYFRALINYNRAIVEVHLRKNSLLEYNSVLLAEGPWPGKAYSDACRRALERNAALKINYRMTRPCEFSQGPIEQFPYRPHGDAPEEWDGGQELLPTPVEDDAPLPPGGMLPEGDTAELPGALDHEPSAGPQLLEPGTPTAGRRAASSEPAPQRTAAAEPAGPLVRFASSVRVVESKRRQRSKSNSAVHLAGRRLGPASTARRSARRHGDCDCESVGRRKTTLRHQRPRARMAGRSRSRAGSWQSAGGE